MEEDEKIDNKEIQIEEQPHHQKPDGILTKNTNGKIFVTRYILTKTEKKHFKISCSR
ncbi:hypothetical protein [Filifactor alocis]|uniref:hypothetical protein n=1 Tax=Filifactor alocis TaxID=143361 RepID=UPI0028D3EB87|nr:hypothetical protein [Filifactor alocis]